jgi:hypothetical protein
VPGTYSVVVQATDTSAPPQTDQLPYTLTVRNEFALCAATTGRTGLPAAPACTATVMAGQTSLPDGVQNRVYGVAPLTQVMNTNLNATADSIPVGDGTEVGAGPIAACLITVTLAGASANPSLEIALNVANKSQCLLASPGGLLSGLPTLTAPATYTVAISAQDTGITYLGQNAVPANTLTEKLTLVVNPPISFSANFDNYSFTPPATGTVTPAVGTGPAGEVPDAVQGRTYGTVGGNGKTSLIFTAGGGLLATTGAGYAQGTTFSLPTGVSCAPFLPASPVASSYQVGTAVLTCNSGATNVTGATGAYTFGLTVSDPGNTATPGAFATTDALGHASHTLMVDPALSFSLAQAGNPTPANPANLLDAVTGRTYGVVGGTPTYTPAGGLGANNAGTVGSSYYNWCVSSGTLPATFSNTGSNLNAACSSPVQSNSETLEATADLTATAGAYPFTVQLNDTGSSTTPSATLTNSTNLAVQPALVATLTQTTNATPTTALLPGVYNRTYGVSGGSPTFTASGGLGSVAGGLGGNYQWCVSAGALPTGFINTGTNLNNSSTCTAPVVENTATLMANPITQNVTTPTAFSFTVRLDDGGNSAVPSGMVSGTANAVTTAITVNPQIALAQSLGPVWPDAVNGRPYGSGTGCTGTGGNCAAAVYTASYGLGDYVWPNTVSTNSNLAGFGFNLSTTCAVSSSGGTGNLYTCSAAKITAGPSAAGSAPINYGPSPNTNVGPSLIVTDTANAATPAATTSTDPASARTDTLTVDSPLLATLVQNGSTNPSALIPGVSGRSYGTGSNCTGGACAAPTYTAAGGLGANPTTNGGVGIAAYEWCVSTGATSIPVGLGGIGTSCSPFTTTGAATETLTSSDVTQTVAAPPSTNFPFTVELADTGNGSTPSAAASSTAATNSTSLVIDAPLAVQLTQAGSTIANNASLLPAVFNRTYGVTGGGAGAPTYTASSGLGGYVFPASPGPFASVGGFSCSSASSNPYVCSAAAAVSASPATYSSLSLTVTDTANAAVPQGSATTAASLLVDSQVSVSTNLSPSPWPDAVNGRTYGSGSGCSGGSCTAMIYTAAGGLGAVGGYTFPTTSGFPTPIGCTLTSPTLTCLASAAVTQASGAYSPTVAAVDVANAATPAATTSTDPNSQRTTDSINVRAALALTPPAGSLATAVVGRSWGQGNNCGSSSNSTCQPAVYTVNNGLGGYSPGPVTAGPLSCAFASTGAFSGSYSCATGSELSAPPSAVISLTVSDTANASTPTASTTNSSETLTINPEMALTPPGSVGPAVAGRDYGVSTDTTCSGGATGCVPLTYTVSALTPGLGGPYTFTPNNFPSGFACATSSNSGNCSAQPLSAGATTGTFSNLNVTVKDTANASTPQGSVNSTPNTTLTVDAEMTLTASSSPFASAVVGRHYGNSSDTTCSGGSCQALRYTVPTATPGLGGPYTFTPNSFPSGFTCATSSNNGNCSASTGVGGGAGAFSPNVTVKDTANASTPPGSITSTNGSLTVDAEMTLTPPGSPFAPAVVGRHYGNSSDTTCSGGNCQALTYTVPTATPGLGGYTFTPNSFPTGFACATSSNNGNCSASTGVGGSAGAFSPNVTVKDTANASTPPGSVTSTTGSLTVDAEMTLTAPSSPFASAVVGRHYGNSSDTTCSGGSCQALTYTVPPATPGLGGPYAFTPNSFPTGFACATSSNNGNCSASTGVGGAAGSFSPNVTVKDTANASTPPGSVTSASGALTVDAEMTLTPPSSPFAPAVVGRHYGNSSDTTCSGGSCQALTYAVPALTPGLGGYTFTPNSFPTGFACVTSSNNGNCSASTGVGGGAGAFSPNVTVKDTANASTPPGSVTSTTGSLTVDAEMTLTPPSSPFAPAVVARHYGNSSDTTCSGGTCQALTYTVPTLTPGLGGYTFTPNSFPTGFACATSSNNGNCSASSGVGGSAGAFSPNVTVKDTANASTPPGSVTSTTGSLTVDAEMSFPGAGPTFADAVQGRTYGTGSLCAPGGTSSCVAPSFTQNGGGLGAPYAYSMVPSGLSFTCPGTGVTTSCTSSSVGPSSGSPYTPNVSVTDAANASTPAATITSAYTNTLTVHPEMLFAATGPTFADGVQGRTYGSGSLCAPGGTSNCVAPSFTQNGGGLSPYSYTATPSGLSFTCSGTSATTNCTSTSLGPSSGSPYTPNVSVADTANTSTPSKTITSAYTNTLTVHPVLTVNTPTVNGLAVAPPPDAVSGRTYGTAGSGCSGGGQCFPLAYNPSGGITPYTITGSGFPAPISCTQTSSTLNCGTSGNVTGGTSAGTISVTDSPSTSAPSGSTSRTSDTITVDPALAITNTTTTSPPTNALLKYPYSFTFAATGGLSGGDTWVAPTFTSGACSAAPTGTFPTGLSWDGTEVQTTASGTLSGTPSAASTADTNFTFQVCVTDMGNATTPAGSALPNTTGNNLVVHALNTYAFVADGNQSQVEVINTGTPTGAPSATPTNLLSTGADTPSSAAVTPDGTQVYVIVSTSSSLYVFDTITGTKISGSPFSLKTTCTAAQSIAIAKVPSVGTRAYIACGSEVDVVDTSNPAATPGQITFSDTPAGVAFKPDGTRVYVTLNGTNKMAIIDTSTVAQISGSPFALEATHNAPLGIVIAPNSSNTYAYIAKSDGGAGTGAVDVIDVSSDPVATLTSITTIANASWGLGSYPWNLALTTESPDPLRVYVSLNGVDMFAVLNNSLATPVEITDSPFSLTATAAPVGIAIPPLDPTPTNGLRVFLGQSGLANVAVWDNATPPAVDAASPISTGAGSSPQGIAAIPVPK